MSFTTLGKSRKKTTMATIGLNGTVFELSGVVITEVAVPDPVDGNKVQITLTAELTEPAPDSPPHIGDV